MTLNRSFLKIVAVVLFIVAAVLLFAVKSVGIEVDLGIIAAGLACGFLA
jgi:hypothetical protein